MGHRARLLLLGHAALSSLGGASASPTARLNQMGGFRDHGVDHGGRRLSKGEIYAQLPGVRAPAFTRPMVDPDTPADALTTDNKWGDTYHLGFSDEFTTAGRSFAHGADPYWTAVEHYNPTTSDLESYVPDAVTTAGGSLVITATHEVTPDQHAYKSGMVTTWNQMCFTGGMIEMKMKLPGDTQHPGLWPAAWLMGNLARAGYVMSTDRVWPWSFKDCDPSLAQFQKFDACNESQVPKHMAGRGGPEFDIMEANTCPTKGRPEGVSDLMRCPNDTKSDGPYKVGGRLFSTMHFTPKNPPLCKGEICGYDRGFEFGDETVTHKNVDGDELHDFIGSTTFVGNSLWEAAHVYRLEYVPTREQAGGTSYGYIRWSLDGQLLVEISADALRERIGTGPPPYYDPFTVHERLISQEPMYVLLNVAVSDYWHQQEPGNEIVFPAKLEVDYIRVYQEIVTNDTMSCNPTSHPTAEYIQAHADLYDGSKKPPVMCDPNAEPAQTCPGGAGCPKCGNPACECPPQVSLP